MKRHKDLVNTPSTNEEPEVFIVPPHILEQLIQLSKSCTTGSLLEQSIVGQSTKNNVEDPGASSILETASLMKQSVFMSPTFGSTVTTHDSSSELNKFNIATESIQDKLIETDNADESAVIKSSNGDYNPPYNLESENFDKYQSIKEYEVERDSGDLILKNVSYETCNSADNVTQSTNITSPIDHHADTGISPEITNNNFETVPNQQKSSKIKILSEHIISHSDLNNIQNSRIPSKSSCFLIPVNTIVKGIAKKKPIKGQLETTPKVTINIDDQSIKLGNVSCLESETNKEIPVENTEIKKEIKKEDGIKNLASEKEIQNKEIQEVNVENDGELDKIGILDNLEKEMNRNTPEVNIQINNIKVDFGILNSSLSVYNPDSSIEYPEEVSHNVETDACRTDKKEQELEIDKQNIFDDGITNESKRKDENEGLKIKLINANNKVIVSKTDNSSNKSKLCIQGVEKPGGMQVEKIQTVLKTYQRTHKHKLMPKLQYSDYTNIVDSNILPENLVMNLDDINMGGYKNVNKFCICQDFGQLENYDSDIDYQHLHFCNHNNVDCNIKTIFKMYDDTFLLHESNITEDIDIVDDVVETTQHDICWLSFICEDNDEAIELAIFESKMDGLNSASGQLRRSTRKRKSTATETVPESVEPKPKKTKCGTCGLILTEAEWNQHKDSDHDSIAWKDGQAIVENSSNGNVNKNALEKKNTTPKMTQPTRRSSRNLGIDVGEVFLDTKLKTNTDHANASSKEIQRSSSIEPKIKKLATNNHVDTPITSDFKDVKVSPKSTKALDVNCIEVKDCPKNEDRETSNAKVKDAPLKGTEMKTHQTEIQHTPEIDSKAKKNKNTSIADIKGNQKLKRDSIEVTKASEVAPKQEVTSTQKSTKRSFDGSIKATEIKANAKSTEVAPKVVEVKNALKEVTKDNQKSKRRSIDVSSNDVDIKDTKVEVTDALKSKRKSTDACPKITDIKDTKSKRMSTDVSSEDVNIKNTSKTNMDKNTLNLKKKMTEACSKTTDIKYTPKSKRRSSDVSIKDVEIKNTSKVEEEFALKSKSVSEVSSKTTDKDTQKSKKISGDISSKATKIKESEKLDVKVTPKSSRESINSQVLETVSLKNIQKSIDDTGSASPTLENKGGEVISKSNDSDRSSNSIINTIDFNKNTTRKPDEAAVEFPNLIDIEVPQKQSKPKSTTLSEELTDIKIPISPTRKLKEIDMFSPSKKPVKVVSLPKSSKYSKNETTLKSPNVESTPKLKRNSNDDRKTIEVKVLNTSNNKSDDASATKHVREKAHEETTEIFTSTPIKETKRKYPSAKSIIKSQSLIATSSKSHRSSGEHEGEKDSNSNSQKNIDKIVETSSKSRVRQERQVQSDIFTQNIEPAAIDTISNSNSQSTVDATISRNEARTTAIDSNKTQPADEIFCVSIKQEALPKCGVCKESVDDPHWLEHIAKEHDYLAWREDDTPLNLEDDEVVRTHLYAIVKTHGGLKCSKCNTTRKYVKSYLSHLNTCTGEQKCQLDISTASTDVDTTLDLDDVPLKSYSRVAGKKAVHRQRSVVCGVCDETVMENKWIKHTQIEHNYLAWKKGETPVNVNDQTEVKVFLQNISKYNGGLTCIKCGVVRHYVKKWLAHVAICKGEENDNISEENSHPAKLVEIEILPPIVTCAKCKEEMPSKSWMDHNEKEHNYLSWIEGQTPLDENDSEAISAYLLNLVKTRGSLYCAKCGVSRKYPKAYLTHINACEISGFKREDYFVAVSSEVKSDEYECAVCHETGDRKLWKKHAMDKHYNVAWMAGEMPINLKNPYAVEKYIKEYRLKHNLVCKVCGASRASCCGFYAHILTCGKEEKDLQHLMNICEICNNKYLCIYRNQHLAMHREQVFKKEKKERDAVLAAEEQMRTPKTEDKEPSGRRRAAEKAKKVMETYTSVTAEGNQCPTCHLEFENETFLKEHSCQGMTLDDGSDSDVSIKIEEHEESEDDMLEVDSCVSDEEEDPMKRKRLPETIPKIVLPFKVDDVNYYLAKSFDNFCKLHYTSEFLFNNWRSESKYSILSEDETFLYLPLLSESCKLRIQQNDWETFQRFEAKKRKEICLFTGATIRCMQWVPHRLDNDNQDNYLSIVCFRGPDCPRFDTEELPQHPGLIQIWNFGSFQSTPKLEMGIAHDYGTIWAMDWCPSGTRDEVTLGDENPSRLGLVAIACSNGRAYILSVPRLYTDPDDIDSPAKFISLKPVAELRLTANPNRLPYRLTYQATSVSWSPQKDHEVVMVGYSDGTTALYNLNTASPLLKTVENDVHIFYPFQDALTEYSSITGVTLNASEDLRRIVGGVASSSVTGSTMSGWPSYGPVVRSHLAASSIIYTPNWPAALLCSDDVLTIKSTNEMDWWGGGRRLGGACAAGACARCGRVCLTAPPFVRVLRAHPCYPELKKQIVATMKMVPLAQKRKLKLVNDDLGMIVEPLTYEDTIKKYGLEFKPLPKKDQNVASKLCDNAEQCPERFPLSDMPAAAFCPSTEHHHRLAIASHAGFVLLIST